MILLTVVAVVTVKKVVKVVTVVADVTVETKNHIKNLYHFYVTKLNKKSNWDKTWKPKLEQILNKNKTQKLKLWQNSKTAIVTRLKKLNCYKTKKHQLIVTKLKNPKRKINNWNYGKTQKLKLWQNSISDKTFKSLLMPWAAFCNLVMLLRNSNKDRFFKNEFINIG